MPNTNRGDHEFDQLLGACIANTMKMAAAVDCADEEEAIIAIAAQIHRLGVPREILALAVSSLAIRMHRTSALNNL